MGCGCNRRARAAKRGEQLKGYRITLPDGTVTPKPGQPPFFSPGEAKAEVRRRGGGTVFPEYSKIA